MTKRTEHFFEFLNVLGMFLFMIITLLGAVHMIFKDFFEGFMMMCLSLIIVKLCLMDE